ncbi:uncharacterized protein I303_101855 [Kwoniella dejecticola CBS 10117]|uniref:Uncharacterized protein n=1 Tax=Kwoniella dejecticola CBS 10117 TaxID=1296121 RepID=A0A1A6ACL4_9TREE|nr:uncharacterized protein I303_02009 [Kwoniella dejecticola CBS 10117]OBR87796.1 hypothetical protein I303_02009 [Kwoniella dejecticola CBS 10117]
MPSLPVDSYHTTPHTGLRDSSAQDDLRHICFGYLTNRTCVGLVAAPGAFGSFITYRYDECEQEDQVGLTLPIRFTRVLSQQGVAVDDALCSTLASAISTLPKLSASSVSGIWSVDHADGRRRVEFLSETDYPATAERVLLNTSNIPVDEGHLTFRRAFGDVCIPLSDEMEDMGSCQTISVEGSTPLLVTLALDGSIDPEDDKIEGFSLCTFTFSKYNDFRPTREEVRAGEEAFDEEIWEGKQPHAAYISATQVTGLARHYRIQDLQTASSSRSPRRGRRASSRPREDTSHQDLAAEDPLLYVEGTFTEPTIGL